MANRQETIIIDVQVTDVKKQLGDTAKAINDLKEQNKQLKKEQKDGTADWAESTATIKANEAQIKLLTAAEKSLASQLKATGSENETAASKISKSNKEAAGSYAALNQEYIYAAQKAKDLAAAYGATDTRSIEAAKAAKALSDKLKDIDSSVGQNQRKVGDYAGEIGKLGNSFSTLPGAAGKVGDSIDVATTAFQGFNAASPVGWITIAVQIFNWLVNSFKSFAPVADAIENGLEKLKAAFDVLKNGVIAVITGQKSLKEAITGAGDEMRKQTEEAKRLAEAQRDLEDAQESSTITQEKYKNKINELLLQSKNRTLSEKQRIALIDEALKVENEAFMQRKNLVDTEVKMIQDKLIKQGGLNKFEADQLRKRGVDYARYKENQKNLDDQTIKDLAAALVKQQTIEGESISLREKALNRKEQLEQADQEKREKAAEKAEEKRIKLEEKRQKAAEAKKAAEQKAEEERLKALKDQADKEIAALDQELALEKLRVQENNAGKKLSNEEYHKQRLAEIDAETVNIIGKLNAQLRAGEITEKQFDDAKALRRQEVRTQIAEENAAFEAQELENRRVAAATDLQNEMAIAEMKNQSLYSLKLQQLENERLAEIEAAEKTGADTLLIEEKYTELKKQLSRAEMAAKLDMASGFAGNIAEIFGKSTKVGKAAASAQIAIDSAKGAFAAFTSMASIPFVGPVLGAAAAGAVVAKGVKSIKDVWAVKSGLPSDGGGGGATAPAAPTGTATNYTPATKGADLVLNSDQAGSLNGKISAAQPASGGIDYDLLAKSMSKQPAPVMVYSEFKSFEGKVTSFDEQTKI